MFVKREIFFLAVVALWGIGCAYSQTVTSVKDGTWNDPLIWDIGAVPEPANSGRVVVNHTVFVEPGDFSVQSLDVNGTLIIKSTTTLSVLGDDDTTKPDLLVNGVLEMEESSTLNGTSVSNTVFAAGSQYNHRQGPAGFIPYGTWNAASTLYISGFTTSGYINIAHSDSWKQTFGNVVYDCPLQSIFVVDLNGYLRNIAGNFIIRDTNNKTLRLSTTQGTTLSVGGNMIVEGHSEIWFNTSSESCRINIAGDFRYLTLSTGPSYLATKGRTEIFIGGSFVMDSSGPLRMASSSTDSVGIKEAAIHIKGNLSVLKGTMIAPPPGIGSAKIFLEGPGQQLVSTSSDGASFSGNFEYTIESSSITDLGNSVLSSEAGALMVKGKLCVGSTHGSGAIQLASHDGNIHIPGPRTYTAGATIEYNGSGPQSIGDGQPITPGVHFVANNATSIRMVQNISLGGNFTWLRGDFTTGGFSLDLAGNVTFSSTSGTFTGNVNLNGESDQFLSAGNRAVENVNIDKSPGSTVVLTSPLKISTSITIRSPDTILDTNSYLTLLSTSDESGGTACIGPMVSGSRIEGDVTIERSMSGEGRIYRYISSPVANATVASLMDDIPVTGKFLDPSTGPGIVSSSPSLFFYDESVGGLAEGWRPYPSAGLASSNLMHVGLGYASFVRQPASETILDFTGTINQGEINLPLSFTDNHQPGNGWNLIGNPYPCAVDWDIEGENGWTKSNISPIISIRDNGAGGIFRYWDGDESYEDIPQGQIALAQSFWVKATGPDPVLTIREGVKVLDQAPFFRKNEGTIPSFAIMITQGQLTDKAFFKIRKGSAKSVDQWDMEKLYNDHLNVFIGSHADSALAIRSEGTLPCGKQELPVGISVMNSGIYQMSLVAKGELKNYEYFWVDKTQNTERALGDDQHLSLPFGPAAADRTDRFFIRISEKPLSDSLDVVFPEHVCKGNDFNLVIKASQPGVTYSLIYNGIWSQEQQISPGGDLTFRVRTDSLDAGNHVWQIQAHTSCRSVVLVRRVNLRVLEVPRVWGAGEYLCDSGLINLKGHSNLLNAVFHWFNSFESNDTLMTAANWSTVLAKKKNYYVMAESNGCVSTREPVDYTSYVSIPAKISEGLQGELLSNYDTGNHWFFRGVELTSEKSSTLTAGEAGIYRLSIAIGSCVSQDSIFYCPRKVPWETRTFELYPNPVSDKIWITAGYSEELPDSIQVWNVFGGFIDDLPVTHGKNEGTVDVAGLSAGVYFGILVGKDGTEIMRFTKL